MAIMDEDTIEKTTVIHERFLDLPENSSNLHAMPPTCVPGVSLFRKKQEEGQSIQFEHRRRSSTVRLEPSTSSYDSRKANSFVRARNSGISRLLKSNSSRDRTTPHDIMGQSLDWTHVVLKMNSFSEEDFVTSFRFNQQGGTIGRLDSNTASIPADKVMANLEHATILYRCGRFYIQSNEENSESGTFIRLNPTSFTPPSCLQKKKAQDQDQLTQEEKQQQQQLVDDQWTQWPLEVNCYFRAGKSDFFVTEMDETKQMLEIKVLSGKLSGSSYVINSKGAGIGRSAENLIHTGDGELSRRHAYILFDELTNRFYLMDLQSTNGTFMRLSGPYQEPYRLEIGDDILVSQTCLTVTRFDYGATADMGVRKNMEDAHVIVQDLRIDCLSEIGLYPQSFFGVFDGHGGMEASSFVGETLHQMIYQEFCSSQTKKILRHQYDKEEEEMCKIIEQVLIEAFEKTDTLFLEESERPQAGSTATTALILGKYLYVANVGDSRTIMSLKGGQAKRLSNDHKPSRQDEAKRIRDTGGFVIHGRIMGELAVSRAFGDAPFKTFEISEPIPTSLVDSKPKSEYDSHPLPVNPNEILKGPLVIATPEITRTELSGEEEFILLASDGLYDVLNDQEAIDFLRNKMKECGDIQRAVDAMVDYAIVQQRSMDNVTALVIMLTDINAL